MEEKTLQEVFEEIANLYESFVMNHNSDKKSHHAKARKDIGEIKKLVTDYRKKSVDADKK